MNKKNNIIKGVIYMSIQKSLENYFIDNLENNTIDYRLRVSMGANGKPQFYIYALGVDSDTLDFIVDDNTLIPKK